MLDKKNYWIFYVFQKSNSGILDEKITEFCMRNEINRAFMK